MSAAATPSPTPDPRLDLSLLFAHIPVGHFAALGIRFVGQGADWCELELPYADALVGDPSRGVLASGPIISLMDMATSAAIWAKLVVFRPQATLDLRIDYLRAARPGCSVIGRGECLKTTHAIGFVRGLAHDGDPADPVAHVAGTFVMTGARP